MILSSRKRQVNEQNKEMCIALEQSNQVPSILSISEPPEKPEFSQELREALPEIECKKRSTTKKRAYEKVPKNAIRFDGMNHVINYDQDERLGCRCKMKGCSKQTTVYCEKCKVHLCFLPAKGQRGRNCFKKFHSINDS